MVSCSIPMTEVWTATSTRSASPTDVCSSTSGKSLLLVIVPALFTFPSHLAVLTYGEYSSSPEGSIAAICTLSVAASYTLVCTPCRSVERTDCPDRGILHKISFIIKGWQVADVLCMWSERAESRESFYYSSRLLRELAMRSIQAVRRV